MEVTYNGIVGHKLVYLFKVMLKFTPIRQGWSGCNSNSDRAIRLSVFEI